MYNKMKKIIAILIVISTLFAFASCGASTVEDKYARTVKIVIDVKDYGKMTLELYPDLAPITVENFLSYVDEGFYTGLTFHRVMQGFMIQGGAGHGGEHAPIKGEFKSNGVENDLSHKYGVISMARTTVKDSATSQFFICNADASRSLDGNYAAFGKLIDGSDVLDKISAVEVEMNIYGEVSQPVETIVINSITRAE